MQERVLLAGPAGAGKSAAIRAVSAIAPTLTDAGRVAGGAALELETGVMDIGRGAPLMLYGAPSPERFDAAWEELVDRCTGVLLLVDHSAAGPAEALRGYRKLLARRRGAPRPLVVGVTHTDIAPHRPMTIYRAAAGRHDDYPLPLFAMDARKPLDVRAGVLTLVALLEMHRRFAGAGTQD